MNTHLRNAAVAAVVGMGMVTGAVPTIGSVVPDGTGEHLRVKWEQRYPDMVGNTLVTVQVIGPAAVHNRWIAAGKEIPSGGIVMGFSEIFKYNLHLDGRPDYRCDVYLSFHPSVDPDTLDHELRHCEGWMHPEWTSANLGAK